ncbi:hypothetical protein [Enterococcus timonensis]|nr:hypothetical protein [Enterococcus timonensis]
MPRYPETLYVNPGEDISTIQQSIKNLETVNAESWVVSLKGEK